MSDDSKKDATTTAEHSKNIIELLQNITVLLDDMSTIWENNYGCEEQYRCKTALYLLSMLEHAYNIIIGRGVGAPGHGREFVDGLNSTDKRFISMLMTTVQLPGASAYYSQMAMHTSTENTDTSLERESQKHLSDPTWSHGLLVTVRT